MVGLRQPGPAGSDAAPTPNTSAGSVLTALVGGRQGGQDAANVGRKERPAAGTFQPASMRRLDFKGAEEVVGRPHTPRTPVQPTPVRSPRCGTEGRPAAVANGARTPPRNSSHGTRGRSHSARGAQRRGKSAGAGGGRHPLSRDVLAGGGATPRGRGGPAHTGEDRSCPTAAKPHRGGKHRERREAGVVADLLRSNAVAPVDDAAPPGTWLDTGGGLGPRQAVWLFTELVNGTGDGVHCVCVEESSQNAGAANVWLGKGDGTLWHFDFDLGALSRPPALLYSPPAQSRAVLVCLARITPPRGGATQQLWGGYADGTLRTFTPTITPAAKAASSDTPPSALLSEQKAHSGGVNAITVCGDCVFTGGQDWKVVRWSPGAERPVQLAQMAGHTSAIRCLVSVPSKGLWFSGSDSTIRCWTVTGDCIDTLRGHQSSVLSMHVLSTDGSLWSGGEDGSVMVWDAATLGLSARLEGHAGPVTEIAQVERDGRVWTADKRGVVLVWDPLARCVLQKIAPEERRGRQGMQGTIRAMGFLRRVRVDMMITFSRDGAVRIWASPAPETSEELVVLRAELKALKQRGTSDAAALHERHRLQTKALTDEHQDVVAGLEKRLHALTGVLGPASPMTPGEFHAALGQRDSHIAILKGELEAARCLAKAQDPTANMVDAHIAKLNHALQDKDAEINRLRDELDLQRMPSPKPRIFGGALDPNSPSPVPLRTKPARGRSAPAVEAQVVELQQELLDVRAQLAEAQAAAPVSPLGRDRDVSPPGALHDAAELAASKAHIEALERELALHQERGVAVVALTEQVQRLCDELAERDARIDIITGKLNEKDARIGAVLASAVVGVRPPERPAGEADAQLAALRRQVEELERSLNVAHDDVARLDGELSERDARVSELVDEVAEKDAAMRGLKGDISDLTRQLEDQRALCREAADVVPPAPRPIAVFTDSTVPPPLPLPLPLPLRSKSPSQPPEPQPYPPVSALASPTRVGGVVLASDVHTIGARAAPPPFTPTPRTPRQQQGSPVTPRAGVGSQHARIASPPASPLPTISAVSSLPHATLSRHLRTVRAEVAAWRAIATTRGTSAPMWQALLAAAAGSPQRPPVGGGGDEALRRELVAALSELERWQGLAKEASQFVQKGPRAGGVSVEQVPYLPSSFPADVQRHLEQYPPAAVASPTAASRHISPAGIRGTYASCGLVTASTLHGVLDPCGLGALYPDVPGGLPLPPVPVLVPAAVPAPTPAAADGVAPASGEEEPVVTTADENAVKEDQAEGAPVGDGHTRPPTPAAETEAEAVETTTGTTPAPAAAAAASESATAVPPPAPSEKDEDAGDAGGNSADDGASSAPDVPPGFIFGWFKPPPGYPEPPGSIKSHVMANAVPKVKDVDAGADATAQASTGTFVECTMPSVDVDDALYAVLPDAVHNVVKNAAGITAVEQCMDDGIRCLKLATPRSKGKSLQLIDDSGLVMKVVVRGGKNVLVEDASADTGAAAPAPPASTARDIAELQEQLRALKASRAALAEGDLAAATAAAAAAPQNEHTSPPRAGCRQNEWTSPQRPTALGVDAVEDLRHELRVIQWVHAAEVSKRDHAALAAAPTATTAPPEVVDAQLVDLLKEQRDCVGEALARVVDPTPAPAEGVLSTTVRRQAEEIVSLKGVVERLETELTALTSRLAQPVSALHLPQTSTSTPARPTGRWNPFAGPGGAQGAGADGSPRRAFNVQVEIPLSRSPSPAAGPAPAPRSPLSTDAVIRANLQRMRLHDTADDVAHLESLLARANDEKERLAQELHVRTAADATRAAAARRTAELEVAVQVLRQRNTELADVVAARPTVAPPSVHAQRALWEKMEEHERQKARDAAALGGDLAELDALVSQLCEVVVTARTRAWANTPRADGGRMPSSAEGDAALHGLTAMPLVPRLRHLLHGCTDIFDDHSSKCKTTAVGELHARLRLSLARLEQQGVTRAEARGEKYAGDGAAAFAEDMQRLLTIVDNDCAVQRRAYEALRALCPSVAVAAAVSVKRGGVPPSESERAWESLVADVAGRIHALEADVTAHQLAANQLVATGRGEAGDPAPPSAASAAEKVRWYLTTQREHQRAVDDGVKAAWHALTKVLSRLTSAAQLLVPNAAVHFAGISEMAAQGMTLVGRGAQAAVAEAMHALAERITLMQGECEKEVATVGALMAKHPFLCASTMPAAHSPAHRVYAGGCRTLAHVCEAFHGVVDAALARDAEQAHVCRAAVQELVAAAGQFETPLQRRATDGLTGLLDTLHQFLPMIAAERRMENSLVQQVIALAGRAPCGVAGTVAAARAATSPLRAVSPRELSPEFTMVDDTDGPVLPGATVGGASPRAAASITLQTLRVAVARVDDAASRWQAAEARAQARADSVQLHLEGVLASKAGLEQQYAQCVRDLEAMTQTLAKTGAQIQHLEVENDTYKKVTQRTEVELSQTSDAQREAVRANTELVKQCEAARETVVAMEASVASHEKTVVTQAAEIERLSRALQDAQQQVGTVTSNLWEELRKATAESQTALSAVRQQFQDEVAELERRLAEKTDELAAAKRALIDKDTVLALQKGQVATLAAQARRRVAATTPREAAAASDLDRETQSTPVG